MSIKELYESLGANYNEALTRLMNDNLIKRFILKFAHEYNLNAFNEAYKNHDNKTMFSETHTFKGVIGNLSLTKLFEKVNIIVELVRNKENDVILNIDKEVNDLNETFDHHIKAILKFEEENK